jgi:hypothetical protein
MVTATVPQTARDDGHGTQSGTRALPGPAGGVGEISAEKMLRTEFDGPVCMRFGCVPRPVLIRRDRVV